MAQLLVNWNATMTGHKLQGISEDSGIVTFRPERQITNSPHGPWD